VHIGSLASRCPIHVASGDFYALLGSLGTGVGKAFALASGIRYGERVITATLRLHEARDDHEAFEEGFLFHPAFLESGFHLTAFLMAVTELGVDPQKPASATPVGYLPRSVAEVMITNMPLCEGTDTELLICVQLDALSGRADMHLYRREGGCVASMRGIELQPYKATVEESRAVDALWDVDWVSHPHSPAAVESSGGAPKDDWACLIWVSDSETAEEVTSVLPPSSPHQVVSVSDKEAMESALSRPWGGIVCALGLQTSLDDVSALASLGELLRDLFLSPRRAMDKSTSNRREVASLYVLTSGVHMRTHDSIDCLASSMWGFLRSARVEIGLAVRLFALDVDRDLTLKEPQAILDRAQQAQRMLQPRGAADDEQRYEAEMAVRDGQWYVPRIVPYGSTASRLAAPRQWCFTADRKDKGQAVFSGQTASAAVSAMPSSADGDPRVEVRVVSFEISPQTVSAHLEKDGRTTTTHHAATWPFCGIVTGTSAPCGFKIGERVVGVTQGPFASHLLVDARRWRPQL